MIFIEFNLYDLLITKVGFQELVTTTCSIAHLSGTFHLYSHGIAAIAPFSHRLTFNGLPVNIQRLRCKVNFKALDFVPHIKELGETLVQRLRHSPTKNQVSGTEYLQEGNNEIQKLGVGKYVVLHLRFDKVSLHLFYKPLTLIVNLCLRIAFT